MARQKSVAENAYLALGKAVILMKKRLDSAIRAQNDPESDSAKIIKNDELIRFAGFVLQASKEKEEEKRKEEGEKIEVVMQEQVLKMAK